MRWDSKEFLELQSKWYSKLKKKGFEDIEQDDGLLKSWHSFDFMRQDTAIQHRAPSWQEYYRLAGHFLHDHQFDNAVEKKAWELHGEGMSIRDIVRTIGRSPAKNKTFKKVVCKRNIDETIRRLAKEMLSKCRTSKE